MLDDFSIDQNIAYKTIVNSLKNNKCSHAYLIESNEYPKAFNFALSFAKSLLCPNNYLNNENCNNCNQCSKINKNDFLELKIIEAETQWIKKSQLDELQNEFSKKSIIGNKKVYIIKNAEKLNLSSSNSLLKFLEEPSDAIIAILITPNIYQMLSTIVSRCQVISLKKGRYNENASTINKILPYLSITINNSETEVNPEEMELKINNVLDFIKYYEDNGMNTLLYINKVWNEYFKDRNEIINAFTIMLLFYKDVFNMSLSRKVEIFTDYESNIKNVESKNTTKIIMNKISVIMDLRGKIKFNINNNLLMDKLIIELEGCVSK